jgi:hypothetical protein
MFHRTRLTNQVKLTLFVGVVILVLSPFLSLSHAETDGDDSGPGSDSGSWMIAGRVPRLEIPLGFVG